MSAAVSAEVPSIPRTRRAGGKAFVEIYRPPAARLQKTNELKPEGNKSQSKSPKDKRRHRNHQKEDRTSCPPEVTPATNEETSEPQGNDANSAASYYEHDQRSNGTESQSEVQSLADAVTKLSNKYMNSQGSSMTSSSNGTSPPSSTNGRRNRPDQVLYVPKGRRMMQQQPSEAAHNTYNKWQDQYQRRGSPLAEQQQNLSPAPSITSIVSEFRGQQRYELRSRASSRGSIFEEDNNLTGKTPMGHKQQGNARFQKRTIQLLERSLNNVNNKNNVGVKALKSSPDSVHCKENMQHPPEVSNNRRRRRSRKDRRRGSQSRDVSCDSSIYTPSKARDSYTYYNSSRGQPSLPHSVANSRTPSIDRNCNDGRWNRSSAAASYPCSPTKQGNTNYRQGSDNDSYSNPNGHFNSNTWKNSYSADSEYIIPAEEINYLDSPTLDSVSNNSTSQPVVTESLTNSEDVCLQENKEEKPTAKSYGYMSLDWAAETEEAERLAAQTEETEMKEETNEASSQDAAPLNNYGATNDMFQARNDRNRQSNVGYYVPPKRVTNSSQNRNDEPFAQSSRQDYSKYSSRRSPPPMLNCLPPSPPRKYSPGNSPPSSCSSSSRRSSSPPNSALSHVLELYDFPANFKTQDLVTVYQPFQAAAPVDIKWVDDTHALAVFSSTTVAQNALSLQNCMIKARPLSEASVASKSKAAKIDEELLPARPRPQTSMMLARRLLTGALGVRVTLSKEEKEKEARAIKQAKDQKKLVAKQREDAWEGFV